VSEEQNLDRNGQTSVQGYDNDQQNAGRLCVDGRDDWVSVVFGISIDSTRARDKQLARTYKFLKRKTADMARPTPTNA